MATVSYIVGTETKTPITFDKERPLALLSEGRCIEPICCCSWLYEAKKVASALAICCTERKTYKVYGFKDGRPVEYAEFAPPPMDTATDIPAWMENYPIEQD